MDRTGPLDTPEDVRVSFLDGEINLSQTFLDLAELDKESRETAFKAISKAQQGYTTVLDWVDSVRDTPDWAKTEPIESGNWN